MSDLDIARLADWLRTNAEGIPDVGSLAKFEGGQSNPTYQLDAGERRYVLRRKPFGKLLPSAHAIEREYRLIRALHPSGFPVPAPVTLCEDASVIGAPFYLMEMIEGRSFWDATLPDTPAAGRRPIYEAMIDTQAKLHRIDPAEVGLESFGKPGNYVGRQVALWTRQYRAAQTETIPEIEDLIRWLPDTVPEQDSLSIIHGDYRIDNLIYATGSAEVQAVIDWELATLGDPLVDFAYLAMNWVIPLDGRSGLKGCDLAAAGIPSLDEAVARYCRATGRDGLPVLSWYFSFNLFRLVSILQGVKARVAAGNAASAHAGEMVARILPFARAAWAEARKAGA